MNNKKASRKLNEMSPNQIESVADLNTGLILVVDDEPDLRGLIQELMWEITPNVLVAGDGIEALDLIGNHRPHAIVSDLRMPRKGGVELLSDLRAAQNHVPFVMVTAYEDKESLLAAIRLGATDFIEKPFRPDQLFEVMKKALALGLALAQLESGLNVLYDNSRLPKAEIERLKMVRSAILAMKYENAYQQKRAAS